MKKKWIQIILMGLFFMGISFSVNAKDIDDTMDSLKEALMDSNRSYNMHKKAANTEEADRADEWSERGESHIIINDRSILIENQDTEGFQSKVIESDVQS